MGNPMHTFSGASKGHSGWESCTHAEGERGRQNVTETTNQGAHLKDRCTSPQLLSGPTVENTTLLTTPVTHCQRAFPAIFGSVGMFLVLWQALLASAHVQRN
eukprot:5044421-Amphidinium_carterae.2